MSLVSTVRRMAARRQSRSAEEALGIAAADFRTVLVATDFFGMPLPLGGRSHACTEGKNRTPDPALHSNILIPQPRLLADERRHQLNAARLLKHLHHNAATPQPVFFTHERPVLADDDARNPIQQDRSRTHGAG